MTLRRRALRERLTALAPIGDAGIALAATALAVAALDHPSAEPGDYLDHFDRLAEDLAAVLPLAADRPAALALVMAGRHRYRGDERDDDDLATTSLIRVIDNRRGVAQALGIIGLEAARRAGWSVEALSFPHGFLLRLEDGDGNRAIIDPAAGWRPVAIPELRARLKAAAGLDAELQPAHYVALDNRAILLRLQNESKNRLLRSGEVARAVTVVETSLLFAPDAAALWREAGLMHMRLDNSAKAVAAFEQFVRRTTDCEARRRALLQLQELKGRPH